MANASPIQAQQCRGLTIQGSAVGPGKDPVDRRIAADAARVVFCQADAGIHDIEIRASVTVQLDNGMVKPVVKGSLFPIAETSCVMSGWGQADHIFHTSGKSAHAMRLQHRKGYQ